jgi:hypothetical protein
MLSKLTGASATVVAVAGSELERSGVAEVQAIDQALVELPPSQRRTLVQVPALGGECPGGSVRRGPADVPAR